MDKWLLYVLVASSQFTCNGAEQKKGFRYEPEPFRSTEAARLVRNWYESREIFTREMAVWRDFQFETRLEERNK